MKKLLQISSLFFCSFAFSQNKISKKIEELNTLKTEYVRYVPLSASTKIPNSKISKTVYDVQLASIKNEVVNTIVNNANQNIKIEIPYHDRILKLLLYKVNLFAEGFHADTDKQKNIHYIPGVYYKGIIEGDYNSLVSFNFFKGELNAVISSSELSNLVIGKIDEPGNTENYIIYEDQKMKVTNEIECHTSDKIEEEFKNKSQETQNPSTVKCVATYFEIDNNLFVANGSNTTTTLNWMTSVFNNMQTLFNNDGVTVSLKSTYIWTTQDPYEGVGTDSAAYLSKFKEIRQAFDGDVGQLVGIDPGGLGGVSLAIGGLCTTNNYVYSDVSLSYSSVPTYSWTIMVITHEFGHNVGSRHTHACAWNGNNTAIDNCAPYAMGANAEGYSCMTDPATIPSSTVKGTMMSYCHLVGGVGINFNNGFGPQPSAAIVNHVESRACLSTDCINLCINGASSFNINYDANSTSATITWSDVTNEDTWQVAVIPYSGGTTVWNTVSVQSYIATGLLPNTYYKFRIKSNCGSIDTSIREYVFLTSANYCSGITMTDTGGITGNYANNQVVVRTIIPNLANNKIKLDFSSFALEQDYDFLYIYNGSSTASTSFNSNGYTGTTNPGSFVSTAPDGALTIRFYSDGGVTDLGWVATTSCESMLGINENSFIDYSYSPNPTNGVVTINSKDIISNLMIYNVQGRLLYTNEINNMATQVDISSFSTGTYFFKMVVNNKTVNFKIVKL